MGKDRGFAMKSIIVIGGDGMLGHKVFQTLKTHFPNTMCTIRGSASAQLYKKVNLFQSFVMRCKILCKMILGCFEHMTV